MPHYVTLCHTIVYPVDHRHGCECHRNQGDQGGLHLVGFYARGVFLETSKISNLRIRNLNLFFIGLAICRLLKSVTDLRSRLSKTQSRIPKSGVNLGIRLLEVKVPKTQHF